MKFLTPTVLLLLLVAPGLNAAPQNYSFSSSNGKNQVTFFSKASVEDFEGTASKLAGSASIDFSKPNLVLRAEVGVAVDSMDTGLPLRNQHMKSREWMDADQFPTIRFELVSASAPSVRKKGKDEWFVVALGNFTLKNITKKISVPLQINKKGEDILVVGRFKVPIQEFGIRGPAAMKIIGLKVSPDVLVEFKLVGKEEKGWGTLR